MSDFSQDLNICLMFIVSYTFILLHLCNCLFRFQLFQNLRMDEFPYVDYTKKKKN